MLYLGHLIEGIRFLYTKYFGGFIMKIYFVRHGHPDYKNDCLTELGHKQGKQRQSGLRIVESSVSFLRQRGDHSKQRSIQQSTLDLR